MTGIPSGKDKASKALVEGQRIGAAFATPAAGLGLTDPLELGIGGVQCSCECTQRFHLKRLESVCA